MVRAFDVRFGMARSLATLLLALSLLAGPWLPRPAAAAPDAGDAFWRVWARTDKPVAERQVSRTWMWGPEASSGALQEPYAGAPGGTRTVQYFDKARMEINDPSADPGSPWYVTNGLLARELMTGRLQTGPNHFDTHAPAQVNVAGDAGDPSGPTYATFNALMGYAPLPEGQVITQTVDRAGRIGHDETLGRHQARAAVLVGETNHRVASVFWAFMTSAGPIYSAGGTTTGALFESAFYATGLPLTEAYWTTVRVGGVPKQVLVQVFERRVLTYTPDNPAGWRVEAGNVGQHYYAWRYGQLGAQPIAAPTSPAPSLSGSSDPASCLDPVEAEFLRLLNDYRRQHGLQPLAGSRALNVAAHGHSLDMGQRGYFSHTTPEGKSPWDRMREAGYGYDTHKGENIAAGQRTAQRAFEDWRNSPGHNANMLKPEFSVIGIGFVEVPSSPYGVYWTTKFGGHVDAAPCGG